MPGINDAPEQLEPLLAAAEEAGATSISGIALHLRGDVRKLFFDWLRDHRPDLVAQYEKLYARGAYAPADERKRLSGLLRHNAIPPPTRFSDYKGTKRSSQPQDDEPEAEQIALF